MRIDHLDHLVLTVADMAATVAFYTRVLGMQEMTFGDQRKALIFGQQKINLHPAGHPIAPHAASPAPGSADLCFITTDGIHEVIAHLQDCGVALEAGPVPRTGATGPITSIYFRDPDGYLLEVSSYDPSERAP
ncbi:VOC family protein [Acidithiobacillus sulfuriphilus]|uniref:VOC family protein n=2 Tax=Acidithiobacillus sulfuriphilus TaxID=1867749 RepID=A0A3M8RJY2_9PROT|nr:VOC family protein [Acidithiobacillus sulfuriphilus]RNF68701.1 VOC family protein [Acidithiobacillus sulfuriphilus]